MAVENFPYLLHPSYLEGSPGFGYEAADMIDFYSLQARLHAFPAERPVSVVIRTKNDIDTIDSLMEDIKKQDFNGGVEIVAVDTESTDGTREVLKENDATIVSITQDEFNYPRSLNRGIEAAGTDNIFMTVGHANFSNTQTLRGVTRALQTVDAAYGAVLPGGNASFSESLLAFTVKPHLKRAERIGKYTMGMFGATNAAITKDAWRDLGGFDEAYAAGGEDAALAKKMIEEGYVLGCDPLLAVHHSHGLGVINGARQLLHWQKIAKPRPFDADSILKRRPDMRRKFKA